MNNHHYKHFVTGTSLQALGYMHLVKSTWLQAFGYKHLVTSVWLQVFGYKHFITSTSLQVLGCKYFIMSTWLQVLGYKPLITWHPPVGHNLQHPVHILHGPRVLLHGVACQVTETPLVAQAAV